MFRLKLDPQIKNQEELKVTLENMGIIIDDNSNYLLSEILSNKNFLLGKIEDRIVKMEFENILLIESFGHEIIVQYENLQVKIKENLSMLELFLPQNLFLRVNHSTIINRKKIKHITPQLTMRFKLEMQNNSKVYVTRTYYYRFKDYFGI